MLSQHDPKREAEEVREQLSSDRRRLVVLFGAGTSQAVGLDGVQALTQNIRATLTVPSQQNHYDRLLANGGQGANVEHVLNRLRLCRELIGGDANAVADGLRGAEARDLDRAICKAIYDRVRIEPSGGIQPHVDFASWLGSIPRQLPVEVFSTNYDLLIERGLEAAQVPFFDGFLGTVYPYFSDAASDLVDDRHAGIPYSWIRLWKLHGSIGWRAHRDPSTGAEKTIRLPLGSPSQDSDFIIFPSRDKYANSRRLPFVALHDRLRRITASGESLLVVSGYSFGDRHINDILFDNLRSNNRLSLTVFLFESLDSQIIKDNLLARVKGIRNLTIYAPDKALINGTIAAWQPPAPPQSAMEPLYWDSAGNKYRLGEFAALSQFLLRFMGGQAYPTASGTTAAATATP